MEESGVTFARNKWELLVSVTCGRLAQENVITVITERHLKRSERMKLRGVKVFFKVKLFFRGKKKYSAMKSGIFFPLHLGEFMIKAETIIRVRYGETDRMGYVYYGVYAQYYEVGRVEALRKIGFSYREMEDRGILLPVSDYCIKYLKPAFYDDEIKVVTTIKELPTARFNFYYECFNAQDELINTGTVTLVFVDREKNKPCPPPEWFLEKIKDHF
jgi:acyl-CoA thioester hydrolase